jgi:hypothetical protein
VKQSDLLEILNHLQSLFATAHKAIAGSGHHERLFEIDALVGVANEEVRKKIRSLEIERNRASRSTSNALDAAD